MAENTTTNETTPENGTQQLQAHTSPLLMRPQFPHPTVSIVMDPATMTQPERISTLLEDAERAARRRTTRIQVTAAQVTDEALRVLRSDFTGWAAWVTALVLFFAAGLSRALDAPTALSGALSLAAWGGLLVFVGFQVAMMRRQNRLRRRLTALQELLMGKNVQ